MTENSGSGYHLLTSRRGWKRWKFKEANLHGLRSQRHEDRAGPPFRLAVSPCIPSRPARRFWSEFVPILIRPALKVPTYMSRVSSYLKEPHSRIDRIPSLVMAEI